MREAFKRKSIPVAAAVLLLALSICVPAFAADTEGKSDERKGSISVTLTERGEKDEAVAGATLILHCVGEMKDEGYNFAFALTPEFEGSGVNLSDLNAEGLAKVLAKYAAVNDIDGTTIKTNDNGFALFDGLAPKLYLVMQERGASGYYPIAPFLVSLPMTSEDGRELIYDIDASPKVEPVPVKPTPSDPSEPFTPSDPSEPFTPSGPPDLPPAIQTGHLNWPVSVKPAPPGAPELSAPSSTPEPLPMIQTGQLKWPVPVLAVAGIILFALGWSMTYLQSKKDNEG